MNDGAYWTIEHGKPPACYPTAIDRTHWVDITPVGAPFKVFLDVSTGVTHDGAEYAKQLMREADKP